MDKIVVRGDIVIGQPLDVVRAQFADMPHHQAAKVHSTLDVSDVGARHGGWLIAGRRRVLGLMQQDRIEVTSHPDGAVTLRSIEGTNAGLLITQQFEAVGPQRTRVSTIVDLPVRGVLRWLKPIVRKGIERDVAIALQEDRADLEQGAYARRLRA